MNNDVLIILTAVLPIAEVRGSIPLGLYLKEPLLKVFLLSILGNTLFIIPALYLIQPVTERLRKFRLWSRFFDWLFERTKKKAGLIEKYEAIGLVLFVGIPLPMTGAWTGCIAASLFKIRFRYAFLSIVLGVIIAAVIVTALCLSGILIYKNNVAHILR
ncbi:MAG: small multi-drug export protein [Candidatus Omnitrophica bacterium]|nr:small multi-drug export protein [Candidatus Omnitrophota bacterium]MDD5352318.1 small multi-drug export protein [Candidatus Omnitrophota bacterium]MDD5549916.1 small multi-drug export protein [Candidatus Omnitrophota bacterium]